MGFKDILPTKCSERKVWRYQRGNQTVIRRGTNNTMAKKDKRTNNDL